MTGTAMKSAEEVRSHFEAIECHDGSVKFRCNVLSCTVQISMKKEERTSTSALRRHLASHGMTEFLSTGDVERALENGRQLEAKRARHGLQNFGIKVSPAPVFFKLNKKEKRLVTVMLTAHDVVAHLRPFTSIEDKGRRVLARCMGASIASKNGCRAMIDSWFDQYLEKVKDELKHIERIALTADGWTNYATEHFAVVTLHYMEPNFAKLVARCIACVHETDSLISAEVIARDINDRLTRLGWPVDKAISAVATDEGSNFRALVTRALRAETGRTIDDEDVICMDHMLTTAFKHALSSSVAVNDLFERCTALSSACRRRAIKGLLHVAQQTLHAENADRPFPCTPILPVITRWGSHYDCAVRLLGLRDALNAVHGDLVRAYGLERILTVQQAKYKPFCEAMLRDFEWNMLERIEAILRPFRYLMILAQGEYYATLATCWATLITNLGHLSVATGDATSPGVALFAANYLRECEAKFTQRIPRSAALAVAVDPRYKSMDIFHRYPHLKAFQQHCLIQNVASLMPNDQGNVAAPHPLPPAVPLPVHPVANAAFDPRFMNMRRLQHQGTELMQAMMAGVPGLPLQQERRLTPEDVISAYRSEDNLPHNTTQDEVLQWFRSKQREGRHEIMLKVAETYIFIPVASAPSERVASTAGQTYTKRRIRLHPAIAEAIIVLHESKRDLTNRIIDSSPELIRHSLQEAFQLEGHAVSDDDEAVLPDVFSGESSDDD